MGPTTADKDWPEDVRLYQPFEGIHLHLNLSINKPINSSINYQIIFFFYSVLYQLPLFIFSIISHPSIFHSSHPVEQILMDEFAACLSVKTLLNMLQLPFQIELKINAHNMSPSGANLSLFIQIYIQTQMYTQLQTYIHTHSQEKFLS